MFPFVKSECEDWKLYTACTKVSLTSGGEPLVVWNKKEKSISGFYEGDLLCCIEGVGIAAQCTVSFSDLLCSPKFGY